MEISLEDKIKQQNPMFSYEITDDHIGVFDNVIPQELCKSWINHFDKIHAAGGSHSRVQAFNRPSHINKDQSVDYSNCEFLIHEELKIESSEFMNVFWNHCYPLYVEKYSVLQNAESHKIYSIKIQKTSPGGGYHLWHFESMTRIYSNRILVFILYLNDIEDGGETEFLYESKRIKPKAGRMVIWPAGFTHTHRGNPPLKSDKYIITGWVEL